MIKTIQTFAGPVQLVPQEVCDNPTLNIFKATSMTLVVGPNGAGKTRMLSSIISSVLDSDDMGADCTNYRDTLVVYYSPLPCNIELPRQQKPLVPSCYSCNSSLKTTKDFYTKKHLHPLSDTEEIKFSWDIDSYLQQRGTGKSNFELTLQFDKKNTAAKNSANTFLLHERFVGHKGMLELFVQTIQYWNENPILNPQVSKREFRFNFTEQHALGFDKANYKNEMLGKIKLDLYDALIQWNKAWKP